MLSRMGGDYFDRIIHRFPEPRPKRRGNVRILGSDFASIGRSSRVKDQRQIRHYRPQASLNSANVSPLTLPEAKSSRRLWTSSSSTQW